MNNVEFNNTRRSNFLGHDGFVWWIGIVENRKDPLNLGRCQVRIKGLHSHNKVLIPTKDLPWAQPMFPLNVTNATSTTLKEGDMVSGFFLDGDASQFPVIFGMFHGIPEDAPNPEEGFNDPRTDSELQSAPRRPKNIIFNEDGSGAELIDNIKGVRYPDILDEPTTTRLCRNEKIDETIVKSKKDSIVTGVPKAFGGTWDEPNNPYNAVNPYNHVTDTESGHVFEMDDTPGAERLHLYHRAGTFSEIHPDGSQVDKIVKDKYTIVMKDDHLYVMGDCSITVKGNAKVFVKKDCDLQVDGNLTEKIKGDWSVTVGGSVDIQAVGSINTTAGTSMTFTALTYSVFASTVDIIGITTTISGVNTNIFGSPVIIEYLAT